VIKPKKQPVLKLFCFYFKILPWPDPLEDLFWLNLQAEYGLKIVRRKIWKDLEQRIIPVQNPQAEPVHEDIA